MTQTHPSLRLPISQLSNALACACICAALIGCSGGGGSTSTPTTPTPPPTPSPPTTPAPGVVSGPSQLVVNCDGVPANGTVFVNAEVEPHVAINPTNPNNLIGSWQQDRWSSGGARGTAVGTSFDGGVTWTTQTLPASRCGGGSAATGSDFERATDPWVTFSPNGVAYQMSLAFSGASLQPGSTSAMLAFRSTDGGRNWSPPITLVRDGANFFNDKNTITADPTDSRFVYAVWDRLSSDNRGPALFARTTDGGATWEPARVIYDPGVGNQTLGSVIVVLPDGTLVNLFNNLRSQGGVTTGQQSVLRSTDKGQTWSQPIVVSDFRGIGTRDPEVGTAIRDASLLAQIAVSPQGQLYAVWQDARFSNGARDGIAISRSTDGGLTWSTPTRVNSDANVQAFTPTVHVRADGTIGVSYFDMRNNTADPATLLVDHWLATSRDGVTWTERRITPNSFDLASAPNARGLFIGDYMGLVSNANSFLPFYVRTTGDLSNRNDVFLTPVNVPTGSVQSQAAVARMRVEATASEQDISPEWRQRIHDNIVRKLEQRVPGWNTRREAITARMASREK